MQIKTSQLDKSPKCTQNQYQLMCLKITCHFLHFTYYVSQVCPFIISEKKKNLTTDLINYSPIEQLYVASFIYVLISSPKHCQIK